MANSALPGGNQLWGKNEQLSQAFRIGLMSRNAFVIQLDVYATKTVVTAADADPNSAEGIEELVDTFTIEIDPEAQVPPNNALYLPIVSN